MGLCVNPVSQRIRVNVDGGYFIFPVRNPSSEEYFEYKKKRKGTLNSKRGKIDFNSSLEIETIKYVERLLLGIEAYKDGKKEEATYFNKAEEKESLLTPEVPNWVQFIPENIKFQIGQLLEFVDASFEEDLEKN